MDEDSVEFYDEEEEDSVPYVSFDGKLNFAYICYPQFFISYYLVCISFAFRLFIMKENKINFVEECDFGCF